MGGCEAGLRKEGIRCMGNTMSLLRWAIAAACMAFCGMQLGCGRIADPSRIKVAKVGDEVITVGDFGTLLRSMGDAERPNIKTKGDLIRAIQSYVDDKVKAKAAADLGAEGKLSVSRKEAEDFVRAQQPQLYETTPEMKAKGLAWEDVPPEQLAQRDQEREYAVEMAQRKLSAERAVVYRAQEGFKNGTLTIGEEEFKSEYELRKDELGVLERIRFSGIQFPVFMPDAETLAGEVRSRVATGENFYAVAAEYKAKNPLHVAEAEIENNPSLAKFGAFWNAVSECQVGDVVGPVYMPAYSRTGRDANGRPMSQEMPEAFLVIKILDHWPERERTLEEAKPLLAQDILILKTMDRLRTEYGAVVYEENIPDPAIFDQTM